MNDDRKGAALITGASAGIGATYADRLARRGHDLILVARDGERLEALAVKLRAETGVKAEAFRADLTDKTDVARVADRLASDGAIDLLINNAGVAAFGDFAQADIERLGAMIDLNVVALARLAHAASGAFAARGHGTIINIGSVVGLMPEFRSAVYGATKAFVLYLTQAMAVELKDKGVRLQAVLPGATYTEIWDRSGHGSEGLDPNRTMSVGELVDAALAGLDGGELVSITSLPDPADWDALQAARLKLAPNLSRAHPAPRYGVKVREPV